MKLFSAYENCFKFSQKREGLQRTGVLVDMLFFAFDNRPPYTILLISGDVDFALALHKLGQRGYTVVLAIPSGVGVYPALSNAGQFVWYWHSIARGEGLVSAESSLSRSFSSDDSDLPNDEEAVVHKGMPQNRYIVGTSSTQTCTINSTQIAPDLSRIQLAGPSANAVSYSDEGSFDETIALDMSYCLLQNFIVLLSSFSTLYQRWYAKELDCSIFGVQELQALIEKVRDVAVIEEEHDGTERKFLIANCRR